MERIRKGSDLPKKSGGHRASNKNIRGSSYRKGHQLYILSSFDSVGALEIHDVARATSCIACAVAMGANVLNLIIRRRNLETEITVQLS